VVDADVYRYLPRTPGRDGVSVGWSGSPTTVGNLAVIAEPLRAVARRADARVEVIGATDSPLGDIPMTVRPWRADTEVADLRRLDIGLLPVPLSEWNKRKFYMKLVQYMALGIPAVCTPLGSNPDVVEHGKTGFLADTPADWQRYIELLVEDGELRARMSEHAAQVGQAKYTLQANAEKIIAAFRSALT
jgi:glycosyltransferase involved in cell wall biosynthesis